MNGPLLILADTYRQACFYAQEHDLGREGGRWRYVRELRHVYGRSGGEFVVLRIPGHRRSPKESAERRDILGYLRASGFTQR